jgi:SAM-dependent methyltransferase
MMDSESVRTIRDFGEQWRAFRGNPGYYGATNLLADIFGPLLPLSAVSHSRVADIGSGTGRIVNMLLDANAAHVYAVEPSAAMTVLEANTAARRERITYIRGPGDILPSDLGLDLVVSIGVLHHVPDPGPILQAIFAGLKPGGKLLVWLYGREGNEAYLRWAQPIRRLTIRLPHRLLVLISKLLRPLLDLYITLSYFLPLPMRNYMREVLRHFSRHVRELTIYDQLNPTYAKYYTREEAEGLLKTHGFVGVRSYHRHEYSWTVIGTRPAK